MSLRIVGRALGYDLAVLETEIPPTLPARVLELLLANLPDKLDWKAFAGPLALYHSGVGSYETAGEGQINEGGSWLKNLSLLTTGEVTRLS